MKGFVLVSEEELYSVQGRGGSSRSGGSSRPSSSRSSSSKPKVSNYISAPYNDKGAVYVHTYMEGVGNTSYTVRGTTKAEAQDKKPEYGDQTYSPVPLPKGTYDVSTTAQKDVAGFGPGYRINASVPTKLDNKTVVNMTDFYVHASPYNNSHGCPVIITAEDKNHGGSASAFTKVSNTIAMSDTVKLAIR
jgi:hypothetical protein